MFRKFLCKIGYHKWKAPIEDYIEEFGCIPIHGEIAKTSVCVFCGAKYNSKD